MHGLWWAVSGHVGARVMLACTDGVSPSRLPVVVAGSIVDTCPLAKFDGGLGLLHGRVVAWSFGWNLQRLQHSQNSNNSYQEARGDGVWDGSGISWTICKQSAPRSRQITMPAPHHSVFYRPDALPANQPTVSKH